MGAWAPLLARSRRRTLGYNEHGPAGHAPLFDAVAEAPQVPMVECHPVRKLAAAGRPPGSPVSAGRSGRPREVPEPDGEADVGVPERDVDAELVHDP
jgi:hypothetical protein